MEDINGLFGPDGAAVLTANADINTPAVPAIAMMPADTLPDGVSDMALAMAYVRRQKWGDLYENGDEALRRGTIFPALDFPFRGEGGGSAR